MDRRRQEEKEAEALARDEDKTVIEREQLHSSPSESNGGKGKTVGKEVPEFWG